MASYEYTVIVNGSEYIRTRDGNPVPWTHDSATSCARHHGGNEPAGTVITIWRRRAGSKAPQVQHRAYVTGSDGIVRRTDR